jgi:hypothetical protein
MIRCKLNPQFGTGAAPGRAAADHLGTEVSPAQGRDHSAGHNFFHDGTVPDGHHQPGRVFGGRCGRNDPRRSDQRPVDRRVLEDTLRNTLSVSCMFMWVILAALCFGAVFDGLGAVHAIKSLFLDRWGLSPWGVLVMMQLTYILMGMFLDDTAMLIIVAPLYVPLVISLGIRPHLVWRALYDHLSDRLHDAALRLQPVSDESHGAAGGNPGGYLPLDHALCAGHDRGFSPCDFVSRNRSVVTQLVLWPINSEVVKFFYR